LQEIRFHTGQVNSGIYHALRNTLLSVFHCVLKNKTLAIKNLFTVHRRLGIERIEGTFGQYLGVYQFFLLCFGFYALLTCVHTVHFSVLSLSTVLKYDTYIVVNITKDQG